MAKAAKVAKPPKTTVATMMMALVEPILDAFLTDPALIASETVRVRSVLGDDVADRADKVMATRALGYPAGLIIQTATGLIGKLVKGHTFRGEGARSAAQALGRCLHARHIAAVKDAYEGIGKSFDQLDRGHEPEFDEALRWLDGASLSDREEYLRYILATIALTARAVLPEPKLDRAKLTFHACAVFLDKLLAIQSAGAYQQFACAAFLYAMLDELGQIGPGALRVETKNLNASDASSKVNGDIQVLRGNRLEEAFEVTANDWRTKVAPALAAGKAADLQRVHIIAKVEPGFPENSKELAVEGVDLTVIDVHAYLRTLMAVMRKPAREAAFVRLYQHLDRHQPDVERVNAYVRLLRSEGLATA